METLVFKVISAILLGILLWVFFLLLCGIGMLTLLMWESFQDWRNRA